MGIVVFAHSGSFLFWCVTDTMFALYLEKVWDIALKRLDELVKANPELVSFTEFFSPTGENWSRK